MTKSFNQMFIDYIKSLHVEKGDCIVYVASLDKNFEVTIKEDKAMNIKGKQFKSVIIDDGFIS